MSRGPPPAPRRPNCCRASATSRRSAQRAPRRTSSPRPTSPPRPRSAACSAQRRPAGRDPRRGGGGDRATGELRWVIDPLDGTTNFLFGVPQFAVSVACEDRDGAAGRRGAGPDPRRVLLGDSVGRRRAQRRCDRGSDRGDLATALVATGFGYDAAVRARQARRARVRAASRAGYPPRRRGRD